MLQVQTVDDCICVTIVPMAAIVFLTPGHKCVTGNYPHVRRKFYIIVDNKYDKTKFFAKNIIGMRFFKS